MFKVLVLFFTVTTLVFSQDLKDVSLQLKWKYQFQFAGFIAAKEKGFYKDIGLNVSLKEFSKDLNIVDEVSNGHTEYAVAAPTSMIDIAKGKELLYVAAVFQSSPLIVLADKSSNIKTIQDFKNKKIMTTGDANTDISLISMLSSQGISFEELNVIKTSFNPKDLLDKKTDLISAYISNEPFVLKELGGEPVIFSPKDYGFDLYSDIIITQKEYAGEHFEEVKQFRSASIKGWEYAFKNIDELVDIIYKKYNTQNKSKEALLYEANELKKLAYYQTDQLGSLKVPQLEKIFNLYKQLGLVENEIDINSIVFNQSNINKKFTKLEREYLKQKGEITMCIDPDWMPFEKFDKNGNYIGMSADYFKLFETILDTKINIIHTDSWSQSMKYSKERKCDILSLVMETPMRKKHLNFTTPYLVVPLVFATKIDMRFINDISDLKGKKLAIPQGYAYGELLRDKYPFLDITDVKDERDGLKRVNKKEFDVYIGTLATVGYIIQNEYIGELKIAGKFNENWSLGIGVRNDDPLLLQVLDKAVLNLTYDQKRDILNKWISIKYEQGFNYTLLYQIFFAMLLIVAFFAYKQYKQKKSIREFGELIDSTLEAILLSKNGICIDVNQSAVEYFGYSSKEQMKGKHLLDFVSNSSKQAVKGKINLRESPPYEANLLRADGTIFPALLRGKILSSTNVRVSSAIDLTQVKQLESQAKLASMGEMIGNISHQWRQPLSVISTAVTGIKVQKEYGQEVSDEELIKFCDYVSDNVQYLSQTIDDFKNFIKGDSEPMLFSFEKNFDSFINIVEASMKSNHIRLIKNLEEDVELNSYPNELIQCFINIFNNSKDAMEQNKIVDEERIIFINQKVKGNRVVVSFLDTAGGIPVDIIKRVFEPYFTTKHKSQGTGLGLHMSYNLIKSMGGEIKVDNHTFEFEGKTFNGAKFILEIPINILEK